MNLYHWRQENGLTDHSHKSKIEDTLYKDRSNAIMFLNFKRQCLQNNKIKFRPKCFPQISLRFFQKKNVRSFSAVADGENEVQKSLIESFT